MKSKNMFLVTVGNKRYAHRTLSEAMDRVWQSSLSSSCKMNVIRVQN